MNAETAEIAEIAEKQATRPLCRFCELCVPRSGASLSPPERERTVCRRRLGPEAFAAAIKCSGGLIGLFDEKRVELARALHAFGRHRFEHVAGRVVETCPNRLTSNDPGDVIDGDHEKDRDGLDARDREDVTIRLAMRQPVIASSVMMAPLCGSESMPPAAIAATR